MELGNLIKILADIEKKCKQRREHHLHGGYSKCRLERREQMSYTVSSIAYSKD